MSSPAVQSVPSASSSTSLGTLRGLAPLFCIVFLGFTAIAAPLAAVSLHVHDVLGFGGVWVGVSVGLQSIATVLTRHRTGLFSDHRGPKAGVLVGLPLAAASGVAYLASLLLVAKAPVASFAVLAVGRVLMGIGESFFVTGCMSWGIARLGAARTGKVMAWQGIGMNSAVAAGVPVGLFLEARFGFGAVAWCSVVAPVLALGVAGLLPAVPTVGGRPRAPLHKVVGAIWRQGLTLALATVPFGAMSTFVALYFAKRGWAGAGVTVTAYSCGYILVRLFFAHLPDRFGGTRVAAVSVAVEMVGQLLLFVAPGPAVAFVAAVLTGVGYSLIFPSMGVDATRRVAPEIRSAAIGNFIAFFDLAVGLSGPVIGLFVPRLGYSFAFVAGAMATASAVVLLTSGLRDGAKN